MAAIMQWVAFGEMQAHLVIAIEKNIRVLTL